MFAHNESNPSYHKELNSQFKMDTTHRSCFLFYFYIIFSFLILSSYTITWIWMVLECFSGIIFLAVQTQSINQNNQSLVLRLRSAISWFSTRTQETLALRWEAKWKLRYWLRMNNLTSNAINILQKSAIPRGLRCVPKCSLFNEQLLTRSPWSSGQKIVHNIPPQWRCNNTHKT